MKKSLAVIVGTVMLLSSMVIGASVIDNETQSIGSETTQSIIDVSAATDVTICERTTVPLYYTFDIATIMGSGGTFSTIAEEYYTVTSGGTYLKIHCYRPTTVGGVGNNIAAARLNGVPGFPDGIYASIVVDYTLGVDGTDATITNALGNNIYNHTSVGDYHSEIILGFEGENGDVDLSIYNEDIVFSNPNPTESDPVTIEATVHGDSGEPGGWQKYGVVVDIGGTNEDSKCFSPSVIKLSNGTYVMWYVGKPVGAPNNYCGRIFRAISDNGIDWQKQGMVMDYGGSYEEHGVSFPHIYVMANGSYSMWYTGIGYNNGFRYHIHRAISYDEGFTWQKLGREMTYGSSYDPDGVFYPFVLYDGAQWRMWYSGVKWSSPIQIWICHAHKADLMDPWIKDGIVVPNTGPYDSLQAATSCILPLNNEYEMFYYGTNVQLKGNILHAVSNDGYSWTKNGIIFNKTLPGEAWYTAYPSVMRENDIYKLWYTGRDAINGRIFYAEKTPTEPGLDATCTVSFYLDSIDEVNLIDRQFNVFVPGGGETTVTAIWIAEIPGSHDIIVEVSDVNPTDSDLSNNIASSQIIVEEGCNNATAAATGPQGAHHDPIITLTYDWTEAPEAVDLFYSSNNGDIWHYLGTDYSVDGSFDWEPEANPGPKPSKYWWIANAKNGADDVGIPANGTVPEAGPFNWKTWDVCEDAPMTFNPGGDNWYFVSFPLDVSGDMFTVFDDAEWGDGGTTWDYMQWYDPGEHSWKSYSIYKPPALNDMPPVDNTMGLWIHLTSNDGDGVLTVGEGVGPASTAVNLYTGWNLVGYPSHTEVMASDALYGTGADQIMVFNPSAPYRIMEVPQTYVMKPGEGYWIHVPFDTVWTVDW
jgi:hypothetical protein